jgi:hypothetical protein
MSQLPIIERDRGRGGEGADTGFVKWSTPPFHRIATMLARSYIRYETKDSELGHFAERQPKLRSSRQRGDMMLPFDFQLNSHALHALTEISVTFGTCILCLDIRIYGLNENETRILGLGHVVMF